MKNFVLLLLFCSVFSLRASDGSAVFESAMEYYKNQQYGSTVNVIRDHLREHGRDPEAERLVPLIIEAYIRTEEYGPVENLVSMYSKRFQQSSFLPRLYYLDGVASSRQNEFRKGIQSFSKALKLGVNRELDSLIMVTTGKIAANSMGMNELTELASDETLHPRILETIRFYTVTKQHSAGYHARAEKNATNFLKLYPRSDYAPQIRQIAHRPASSDRGVVDVAVLAPLSGEADFFGKKMVQGIQTAFDNHNRNSSRQLRIVTYDTEGNMVTTAHRSREILQRGNQRVVIGPVLSDNAVVSASLFSGNNILMVTPTASEQGLAGLGDNIFQMNITFGTLGQSIARYAVENLNIREFAVISPNSQYGRLTTDHFLNELRNYNDVSVVHVEYFEEGIHDFAEQIRNLRRALIRRRLDTMAAEEGLVRTVGSNRRLREENFADSTLSIGGIFMPIESEDVVMLAPQLVFHRLRTQMLGSSGWHNKLVTDEARQYVNDAVLSTAFQINEESSEWKSFERAYKRRYNEEPNRVSAMGFDAAQLVIRAVNESGGNFNRLKNSLSNITNFQGLAGTVSFNSECGANQEAVIMRIVEDGFIRVY
ncbi:Branched-chain amino acid ABC transporter, amino acid-binding protein [Chitinispirillum alkaliphilum]|nr:Branched-chain amino acid ABC transporter, amino acid-binding protein [Chitinispirillum alkaliphilum]